MYKNSEPLFEQIKEILLENIKNETWPVHSKIPDEIALSKHLKVSRGTLRKAIKELISLGMLKQIRGKGTFVVSNQTEHSVGSSLISFSESMKQQGIVYKTIVLKKTIILPDMRISALLELQPGEKVTYIERVRLIEHTPVIYLRNYVPLKHCNDLINDDLENIPLFECIEKKYHHSIQWGRRYFKAVPALREIATNLGVEVATPIMYLEQIVYHHDSTPLECSYVWINSDHFEITSILQR